MSSNFTMKSLTMTYTLSLHDALPILSPGEIKYTPNHHYNGTFVEPWGERSQRGYGVEILRRFFEEVAFVEFGGNISTDRKSTRLNSSHANISYAVFCLKKKI